MTLVAAIDPDGHGRAVLHLAALLARSTADDVLLCAVIPAPWPPGVARVDAEYQAELERTADRALTQALARLPADLAVARLIHHARSSPAGLLEVAERRDAAGIVAGSSTHGAPGQIALGSVTSRLMHSAPLPVALAPRGFRCTPDGRLRRITAAFGGTEGADDLVIAAAGVAARAGATLRIASFAVRPHAPYTAGVGTEADASMVAEWTQEIEAAARTALTDVDHLPAPPPRLDVVVGHGRSWEDALEDVPWGDGDVLVVGSSAIGPVARVFLGSRATKIVRHSPVPVVVVPRAAAAELAAAAEAG